jgi:hypothetical protein
MAERWLLMCEEGGVVFCFVCVQCFSSCITRICYDCTEAGRFVDLLYDRSRDVAIDTCIYGCLKTVCQLYMVHDELELF